MNDKSSVDGAECHAVCVEAPTTCFAVGGASLGEPVVVVSLEGTTSNAWAARGPVGTARPVAANANRARIGSRGWAYRSPVTSASAGAAAPHWVMLYHNTLADWGGGWKHRCWAHTGMTSNAARMTRRMLERVIWQVPPQEAAGQHQHQPHQEDLGSHQGQQQQQQQQQSPRRPRSSQAQHYSVPTLAVGDVFLSCNTVAGLEHADDWDLGSLGSRLGGGGATSTASQLQSQPPPGPRTWPLDPASELLLRLSAPVGGQRLMFVSKESAELVRRALLLSRYDEILERRAAAAEEDEAASAGTAAAPSTRLVVSTSGAAGSRGRGASASWTGSVPGWGSAGRDGRNGAAASGGDGDGDGAAEDQPKLRPPFALWSRPPGSSPDRPTASGPPGPGTKAAHPKQPEESNTHVVANASSSMADSPAGVALFSGKGGGGSASNGDGTGGGGGGGAHDGLHLDVPDWVPGPLREAALAVGRGVGGLLAHAGGGAAAATSSIPEGVAALMRRGVIGGGGGSGGVLDVSQGPRPRLPARPLTHAMQLPQLPPPGGVEDLQRQQQQPQQQQAVSATEEGHTFRVGRASGSPSDRSRWDGEALMRELKQLEEEKVIADAEALLQAGPRGRSGGGGAGDGDGGGFLPPFSFSSYVARLPLEAALKAILSSQPSAVLPATAASPAASTDAVPGKAAVPAAAAAVTAPARRRFLLCPDSVDEQAVEGSRELDRLVAEIDAVAAAAAAEKEEAEAGRAAGVAPCADMEGPDGAAAAAGAEGGRTAAPSEGASGLKRRGPRPRVALNLYDSDSSHWVLDVVDELEQEASETGGGSGGGGGGFAGSGKGSGGGGGNLPTERFIRGTPGGPSEDLGGLVQLPAAQETATAGSAASDSRLQAAGLRPSSAADSETSSGLNSGAAGRTPVFLLPGVTVSVRAADGTLLRLRPAFLTLQQLAAALALVRDAAAAAWRRQRSAARWKVVSALDVLTVHGAGFPVMRFPPTSPAGGVGAAGASSGGGGGGDEDSDDGIPEAKELLREMGAGNRRPSAADMAAAAAAAGPDPPPSGPLAVLSTMAVGVVSFSAWCMASAADVWEEMYSRTPWGLEEIGVPQHINVTPTYLEEHVRHLAEVNAPAVAAAAATVRSRAVQRAQEQRAARRRQAQQLQQQQQQQDPSQAVAASQGGLGGEQRDGAAEGQVSSSGPTAAPSGRSGAETAPLSPWHGAGAGVAPAGTAGEAATSPSVSQSALAVATAQSTSASAGEAGSAAAGGTAQRTAKHQRAAAAAAASFSGLSLQTETLLGLTVLLQFVWAAARAAHVRAQSDGIFSGDVSGGGGDGGLLRLAGGGRAAGHGGFAAGGGAGGGGGLTLTASQDGELGLVAKLDIKPATTAALAAAAGSNASASAAPAAGAGTKPEGAGAGREGASAGTAAAAAAAGQGSAEEPPQQQQQQGSVAGPAPAAAAAPGAASASAGAAKPGGLSIRELGPVGRSGVRYELLQSSAKLVSQVTRPHNFEVALHLNLRKLLGDLPEHAPDQLLRLQQPAGPTPAAAGAGGVAARRVSCAAASAAPEAHGLILIGDLGLDDVDEGTWLRSPALGFADLGGLLPPPAAAAAVAGPRLSAATAAAAALLGGGYGEGGSSEDEESGSDGGSGGGRGVGDKAGAARSGGWLAGAAGGSRGWAAGGPRSGVWGRWGR